MRGHDPDGLPERMKRGMKLELDIQWVWKNDFQAKTIPRRGAASKKGNMPLEWVDWFSNGRLLEEIGNIPPAKFEMTYCQQQKESADAA